MSDEAVNLARQKKLKFIVNRGQAIDVSISVNNADGSAKDFTGYTAEMLVYNSFSKTDTPEFEVDVALSSGTMTFTRDAITRKKEYFVYQLWITDPSGYRQPWTNGPFLVLNREWDQEEGEDTIIISPNGDNITLTIDPGFVDDPLEIKTVSAATYLVLEEDNGKMIHYTHAAGVAITLPNGLSDSHITQHVKKGTGNLTFSAAGTLQSAGTILATQYNAALAIHEGSNVWGLYGNLTS